MEEFEELRSFFEQSGDWEPYGSLVIETDGPGYGVFLDGGGIGTTTSSTTKIRDVTCIFPGPRWLATRTLDSRARTG